MTIQKTVEQAMRSLGLSPASQVFLAISGGVDSVVLAHILKEAGFQATWLHMNFQLRGEESDRDQRFVEELAKSWGQSLLVSRVDAKNFSEKHKISIQEAARQLRYEWFATQVSACGKQAVLLTAHQADDNVETLLMNFLRGTGLRGLTGIPAVNDYIRRPMLEITRAGIEEYASLNGIEFVEDSSNRSTDYTRNQLRLEVMPMLRALYPQVDGNLQQNIQRFKSAHALYRQAVQRWIRKYVQVKGREQQVSCALLLQAENRAILHEWLSMYGFTEKQEGELIRLGESESGHFIVSADGGYRVIKHRKHFILSPVMSDEPSEYWVEEGMSSVRIGERALTISLLDAVPDSLNGSSNMALLNAAELHFPLMLRKWRAGDYFYPLGLNKKKKLSRFLIDQKLSKTEKENVWVLESGQRIVWVVGMRIDHRVQVTPDTRSVIRLELRTASES